MIQVGAGDLHTVGFRDDGSLVAAGLPIELGKWDLL